MQKFNSRYSSRRRLNKTNKSNLVVYILFYRYTNLRMYNQYTKEREGAEVCYYFLQYYQLMVV